MFTIFASDKSLDIYGEEGVVAKNLGNPAAVAETIKYLNIDLDFDDIFFSSSMDFAEEYGFETNNGAKDLFNAGIREYYNNKKEVA